MKRFLLFKGSHYYPSGGWYDLEDNDQFDTYDEAVLKGSEHTDDYRWWHVVDLETGKVVRDG